MSECRIDAANPTSSSVPTSDCAAETATRLTRAASSLYFERDPARRDAKRSEGQALLEQGTNLLARLGDGPGATQLASALRGMERTLARVTPEEASAALPSRPTSRRERLAQTAQRSVAAGATAYARTGDPEAFANAVVGDLSDRHLRALGRLSESDLRATLADQGITGERADAAIDRVKSKIAGKFQRVVQARGQAALEATVERLRDAAQPGTPEFNRLAGPLIAGQGDELLNTLEHLGVNTRSLRHAVSNFRGDGRALVAAVTAHLPSAMNQAANAIAEQAAEITEWGDAELYRDAAASRAFPGLAQSVKDRWAMGGIVGEAVNAHVSEAREDEATRLNTIRGVILVAGVIAGVATGGAGALAIGAMSATAREGINVQRAWEQSELTRARTASGLAGVDEMRHARDTAVATTAVAGAAAAADVLGGAVIHRKVTAHLAAGMTEIGASVVVEHAAHWVLGAVTDEPH